MSEELLALAERCEKAAGPDRELELEIADALGHTLETHPTVPSYTASIDAALTLLEEWSEYDLTNLYGVARAHVNMADEYGGAHGSNECGCMAPALCAAALRAMAHGG